MADTSSSSTSAFVSTLIFTGAIAAIFVFLFIKLRPREKRVYQPRLDDPDIDIRTLKNVEKVHEPIPKGYFEWVPFLLSKPQSFLIQHCSIDGYFFLRYIAIFGSVSLLGCIVLFPILLPVNATHGDDLKGFELLGMSNVKDHKRFYASVFMSWIYFGLIIYIIYRELYYYVTMRHAIETTKKFQNSVYSKTVIITDVDLNKLDKTLIYKKFDNIENVSLGKNYSKLNDLCEKREKFSKKLEGVLNKVINKSVSKKIKYEKKHPKDNTQESSSTNNNGDDDDGLLKGKPENDFQSYIGKRPHHRLGKIPFFGEKVDSIDYYLKEIKDLNKEINDLQNDWESELDDVGALFITFKDQYNAQKCYQSIDYVFQENITHLSSIPGKKFLDDKGIGNVLPTSKPFGSKYIGYGPNDLNWGNLSLDFKSRHGKKTVSNTILTLMLIYWAIPVAVVGVISNINFLTDKIHFLKFIDNCPKVLLGLITGLLPVILLSLLMSFVPVFIKKAGKFSGLLTYQEIDLYCQKWYFAFQVIEVFIMTTAASSASSTVTAIINDPSSAMTLLASNLPKASNFYISYFLLQGLTVSSGMLLQLVALILSKVLGRFLDKTPRQKWTRWNTLSSPTWGIVYPVMELFTLIYLCYSIISPLILVFSTVCFSLMYLANIYTYNYVSGFSIEAKGRNYVRALFQVFCALYLAEVCLLGLFIMGKSWGCVVLNVITMVVTVLSHLYFQRRFLPLVDIVPLSILENTKGGAEGIEYDKYPIKDQGLKNLRQFQKNIQQEKIDELNEIENNPTEIRPATDVELQKANFVPENSNVHTNSHHNNNDGNNVFHDQNELEDTSDLDRKQTGSNSLESNATSNVGKTTFAVDETRTRDPFTNTSESGNNAHDEEEFRKLHYEDIKNLKPPTSEADENADRDSKEAGKLYDYPGNIATGGFNKAGIKSTVFSFFHPSSVYNFKDIKQTLPKAFDDVDENTADKKIDDVNSEEDNQDHEELMKKSKITYQYSRLEENEPIIWIAKDPMGISESQIAYARTFDVDVRNDFTGFDDKGKSTYSSDPPDFDINDY